MLQFLADENFNNDILRGLARILPAIDIVRVQDTELVSRSDEDVLEWAARENRILLTHDRRTIPRFAYERLASGRKLAGVFIVPRKLGIGEAIQDLLLLTELSVNQEWECQILDLPLM